jgi:hypothetical protein
MDHIHDIEKHERQMKRTLLPFAIAVIALVVLALMFLRYV